MLITLLLGKRKRFFDMSSEEVLNRKKVAERELFSEYVKNNRELALMILELETLSPSEKEYSDLAHHISKVKQITELYRTIERADLFLNSLVSGGLNGVKIGGEFTDTGVRVISRERASKLFPEIVGMRLEDQIKKCRSHGYLIDGTTECDNEVRAIFENSLNLWEEKISQWMNKSKV